MALKRWLWIVLFLASASAWGQSIFTCAPNSFVTTNTACGVGGIIAGSGAAFKVVGTQNGVTPSVSGGAVIIAPSGGVHYALSMMYQTKVDVRAFDTTVTFISNNQNIALTFNNCANNGSSGFKTCGGFNLANFSSGASCEGGFSQAFSGNPFPYNIFALMFDQFGEIPGGGGTFGYSNVQIYQQNQSPCNPSSGGSFNSYTTKVSTSPVAMNSPATTQGTTTGDTYAARLTYDGSTLSVCMIDVTLANGTCTSGTTGTGTFFTNSWSNVSIPSQVDGTTAYVGMVGSSGTASSGNLEVTGWSYTVNSATATPSSTATSAGATTATNPTFSPVAGSYSGTQTVTITSAGSSNICYMLAAANATIMPIADQNGGCGVGTSISSGSTVSVASSQTLYATAGLNNSGLSSGVVQGAYTISANAVGNKLSGNVHYTGSVKIP